jgi:hypothetical protein
MIPQNDKIYMPAKLARPSILAILQNSKVPVLGVLTSFPSNPHSITINENTPEHFATFDVSKVDSDLAKILAGFKADRFPNLIEVDVCEWEVEDV